MKLGFNVEESDMITSLTATYHYIKERNLRPMLFIDPDALTDFAGFLFDFAIFKDLI